MPIVYKISENEDSQPIKLRSGCSWSGEMSVFDGGLKSQLSPQTPFALENCQPVRWNQFCKLAPGCLVMPEDVLDECADMFYALSLGSELLSLGCPDGRGFKLVNPTTSFPQARVSSAPFDFHRFFAPVFRLLHYPATDLFCISGSSLSGDDFKKIYDENGFTGLGFEEIWRE